ncbi:MAG: GTP cyclohydrolase I FolE [Parvibaculales bacterium]
MKPSRKQAEDAVRILIEWAGDNPEREGLQDTPKRVVNAYEEFFRGYSEDPEAVLARTFDDVNGYDDMVILRDICLESHCEHHMVPILGKLHLGYLPKKRVAGLSKLARIVDVYAKRLQTQETMTRQITDAIQQVLEPYGVGVVIEAKHQCMTTRGVHKPNVMTVTRCFSGIFKDDKSKQEEFMQLLGGRA